MLLKQNQQMTLLLTILLCLSGILSAQKAEKLSPLTVSVEVATPLAAKVVNDSVGLLNRHKANTYGRLSLGVGYRINRWLTIRSQLQYHRTARTEEKTMFFFDNYVYDYYQKTNYLSSVLGPELLLRVGQGDLSLSLHAGLAVNFSKTRAIRQDGPVINITYKPATVLVEGIGMAYTYWPDTRIGVRASLSLQRIGFDKNEPEFLSPETASSTGIDRPLEEMTGYYALHPRRNSAEYNYFLGLGIYYRLGK